MTMLAQSSLSAHQASSARTKEQVFTTISQIMEKAAGIVFPESKSSLVHSRITKRVVALRMSGVDEYMDFLESRDGASELEQLIFALTTNVTRFFREPHHFEDLRNVVFPALIKRAKLGERVRIWSAGCSSGEEPYTIAMTALLLDPDIGKSNFKILATDLDRNVINKGKAGKYPASALSGIPAEYHGQMSRKGDEVVMSDAAKSLITFRELNLLHDWPFAGSFDVIFCRNVVIYFSDKVSDKLWGRFAGRLMAGGRLFAGHSERIRDPSSIGLKPYGTSSYEKL